MPARWLVALIAFVVVLVSAAPRLLLAVGALPEWLRPFTWSDVYATYVMRGLAGHRLPYTDAFFEYPPGIGYIAGLFSLLSPGVVWYMVAWTLLLAFAAGAVAYVLAVRADATRALRYWSLSPQLVLLSGLNFDVLPTSLLACAAVLSRDRRHLGAIMLIAVGTATKVFPLVAAPLEAARASRSLARRGLLVGVFVAVLAAFFLPTLFARWSGVSAVAYAALLVNADSFWGLVLAGLSRLGVADADFVIGIAVAAGFAATYLWAVTPRALRERDPAAVYALAVFALLFWTRLYSPQFSLWVLPFFALLSLRGRTFALLSVADAGVFFSVYPLTIITWREGEPAQTALFLVLLVAVVLRHVALLLAWLEVFRRKDAVRA